MTIQLLSLHLQRIHTDKIQWKFQNLTWTGLSVKPSDFRFIGMCASPGFISNISAMYKWKPNKTQRREFAIKMQDPEFAQAYQERKKERFWNGNFIPTKQQHDFCFDHMNLFVTSQEKDAANQIIYGYSCQEKVSHDFIHIVNEKRRCYHDF